MFWIGLLLMIDLFSLILWLLWFVSVIQWYFIKLWNLSTIFYIWLIEKTLAKNSKLLLRSSINCQLYFISDFKKSSKRKKEQTERAAALTEMRETFWNDIMWNKTFPSLAKNGPNSPLDFSHLARAWLAGCYWQQLK